MIRRFDPSHWGGLTRIVGSLLTNGNVWHVYPVPVRQPEALSAHSPQTAGGVGEAARVTDPGHGREEGLFVRVLIQVELEHPEVRELHRADSRLVEAVEIGNYVIRAYWGRGVGGRAGQGGMWGRAGQGGVGWGRVGQGGAGRGRWGRAGQGGVGWGRAGQGGAGWGRAGRGRVGQGGAGRGRVGQGGVGRGRAG